MVVTSVGNVETDIFVANVVEANRVQSEGKVFVPKLEGGHIIVMACRRSLKWLEMTANRLRLGCATNVWKQSHSCLKV